MNEHEKELEQQGSGGKIYTGEGFVPSEQPQQRTPRHSASTEDHPQRRSEVLREEEAKQRSLAESERMARKEGFSSRERLTEKRKTSSREKSAKEESSSNREQLVKEEKVSDRERLVREKRSQDRERLVQRTQADSDGKRPKRHMSLGRKLLCAVGAVVAVIYVGVAIYFGSHFYAGTSVYGIDCSRKTADEVKAEIADKLGDYVLTIEERENKTETISAQQIDLQYEDDGSIDQLLKDQRSYIWPVMILLRSAKGSPVAFSYDVSMAKQCVSDLDCMDTEHMVKPLDAYIAATDTGFEVAPEVMGTTLDAERTQEAVLTALNDGLTALSLEEAGCYENPEILQDDTELQADAEAMSALASASITLDFGSEQEIVDASVIQNWITKMTNGEYVIDDVCVTDYVESLAAKYDTFGLPVEFYTSIGTVEILSGGDYGWCLDQNATAIELLEALNNGYRGTMEPVYLYQGMSHENNGIGYTYVEICISKQEMWCYEDGNLIVDTPVVTGNPNKGNATPSGGVWAVDNKQRNATLVGEGYSAPVDYWIPFNGNVGIHDLQTRAYFGGTIYLTNGSHGCVNTPYDAVQLIYNTISVGTPVIVYE